MPTDNFSSFRRKLRIPPGWSKPCKAGQWGDGVLAASAIYTPPSGSTYGPNYFYDLPAGVVPDGLGGAFVLTASQTLFDNAQGPIGLRPISATGQPGPLIFFGYLIGFVGVIGPWSDGTVVPSGPGRCIVSWGVDWNISNEVNLQRYDQAGTPLWNAGNPVAGCTGGWTAYSSYIVAEPDGSEGAIFAWLRPNTQNYLSYGLRLQRVSASGTVLWGPDGVTLGAVDGPVRWKSAAPWPQLIPDGSGGALALSIEGTSNCVVYRLQANGTTIGPPTALFSMSRNSWIGTARIRRAVTDGAGGFYLGYVEATNGELHVLRYSPVTGVVWNVTITVGKPIEARAFHVREDDRGGLLVTFLSTPSHLQLLRLDRNGSTTWSINPPIALTIPMGSAMWTTDYWSRLAQAVPDGDGGALLVFQDWANGRTTPELHSQCFDSTGTPVSPAQVVSARATTKEYPIVTAVGRSSAVVAWAASTTGVNEMDVYAQRLGCCPPSTIGLEHFPPFGCEIIQFSGLGFNEMMLQFPCGNRDRQIGVVPLTRLFSMVRGLDYPGSIFNRDVQPPAWMRISFSDLPDGTQIQLYSMKGKLIAESKSSRVDRKVNSEMSHLTFKPSAKEDQLLLFSNENKFEPRSVFTVRISSEWGDGKPPQPILPQTVSEVAKLAKSSLKRKSPKKRRNARKRQ